MALSEKLFPHSELPPCRLCMARSKSALMRHSPIRPDQKEQECTYSLTGNSTGDSSIISFDSASTQEPNNYSGKADEQHVFMGMRDDLHETVDEIEAKVIEGCPSEETSSGKVDAEEIILI